MGMPLHRHGWLDRRGARGDPRRPARFSRFGPSARTGKVASAQCTSPVVYLRAFWIFAVCLVLGVSTNVLAHAPHSSLSLSDCRFARLAIDPAAHPGHRRSAPHGPRQPALRNAPRRAGGAAKPRNARYFDVAEGGRVRKKVLKAALRVRVSYRGSGVLAVNETTVPAFHRRTG